MESRMWYGISSWYNHDLRKKWWINQYFCTFSVPVMYEKSLVFYPLKHRTELLWSAGNKVVLLTMMLTDSSNAYTMKTIHISFLFISCRTNKFKGSFVFVYFWWLDCSKLLTIHTHERTIIIFRHMSIQIRGNESCVHDIVLCFYVCVGPRGGVFVEVGRQRGPDLKIKWNNTRIYWPKGKFLWRKTQRVRDFSVTLSDILAIFCHSDMSGMCHICLCCKSLLVRR